MRNMNFKIKLSKMFLKNDDILKQKKDMNLFI